MTALLISLAALVGGYFVYGLLAERIFGTEPLRPMPCHTMADGVDYMPMPTWKVFLIQFLNIAGLGPIFGAIMGACFGPAAFIWIVAGTIFGGAVHDFISAMMSVRSGGESLPELIGRELGPTVKNIIRVVSTLLLILVGAVFIITPAGLLAGMTPEAMGSTFWIAVIFLYYIAATMLPVDKLIGRFYPVFGFALLFMALGLLAALFFGGHELDFGFSEGLFNRHNASATHPLFPMMCVSIACGAISGFHATQSPMMARCLKNERLARPVFYGAMVAEGMVALIWAAAAVTFTGGYAQLQDYVAANGAGGLVHDVSVGWLGSFGGILALLGVIVAPITTGDTALRSARLALADMFHISQASLMRRLAVTLPVFAITFVLMMLDFNVLWRYFACTNQFMAAVTLWACTVWLARHGKAYLLTLAPAVFMTIVVTSYILTAPAPEGFGMDLNISLVAAGVVDAACVALFARYLTVRRAGVDELTS